MSVSIATILCAAMLVSELPPGTPNTTGPQVRMTVTANVEKGKRTPQIEKEDVIVKQGKEPVQVTGWAPARGERAGLELFFLIDDASARTLGSQFDDLRTFINAQPSTTAVGIGYARNGTVQVVQNLTPDHALAAKSLRLPMGSVGAYGSPYLSATELMRGWTPSGNRREIVLVTDGIDRAGRGHNALMNPDVDTAAEVAQKTGTIIHSIYFPGMGHWYRNFWQANYGQNGLAKLSDMTGGESFFLGLQAPVSISPYLDQLQQILDNQYLLTFTARPGKKAGLQSVTVMTEVAGVDFSTPDTAWVPAK
jgi:hypothetical protein